LLVDRSFDGVSTFNQHHLYDSRLLLEEHYGETGHLIKPDDEFSLTTGYRFRELTTKDHAWLKFTIAYEYTDSSEARPVIFVANMSRREGSYGYQTAELMPQESGEGLMTTWYLTPEIRSKKDKLVFYFWNRDNSVMKVLSIRTEVYERKENR
ncbi:MAG: hypothetical protein R6V49_11065, partial [Bacteroidales bacterium]